MNQLCKEILYFNSFQFFFTCVCVCVGDCVCVCVKNLEKKQIGLFYHFENLCHPNDGSGSLGKAFQISIGNIQNDAYFALYAYILQTIILI